MGQQLKIRTKRTRRRRRLKRQKKMLQAKAKSGARKK
jgi:hypothetical protein